MTKVMFSDSKSHYEILDGLRGVAAITVVVFHIFEFFSGFDPVTQIINHGYLAVDFFFLLSGFVVAHAYDDRWNKMSLKQFAKRRLIRLHPMIIMGMLIGAALFYPSHTDALFASVSGTPLWEMFLLLLLGVMLLPVTKPLDIRGWDEMYPLNGPAWSLFFEYIANILYALFLRKTSVKMLAVLAVITGGWLTYYVVTSKQGNMAGGWTLSVEQVEIGLTRLLYPFISGMLLSRLTKPTTIKHGFLLCSVLLVTLLSIPRIGGEEHFWMNGLYEAITILFIFPAIVYLGASGKITGNVSSKVCTFLGDVSYPLYITHYPIIYVYYAWLFNNKIPTEQGLAAGVIVFVVSIAVAYAIFKLYDVPVRRWLTKLYA